MTLEYGYIHSGRCQSGNREHMTLRKIQAKSSRDEARPSGHGGQAMSMRLQGAR